MPYHFLLTVLMGGISCFGLITSCFANDRIALVVTNQDYPASVGRLDRTHEDGRLVAAALRQVGFAVTVLKDANKQSLTAAVARHVEALSQAGPDSVGFFYYSGHGANVSKHGDNYLIPTEAPVTRAAQLPIFGMKLGNIIEAIEASGARTNFIVIDACRNVPISLGSKSATKGLVAERERSGVMISFATGPGDTAVDENVFARALADEIPKGGRPAVMMFRAVRREVLRATNNRQFPWTRDGLVDDFYFAQGSSTIRSSERAAPSEPRPSRSRQVASTRPQRADDIRPACFRADFNKLIEGALSKLRYHNCRFMPKTYAMVREYAAGRVTFMPQSLSVGATCPALDRPAVGQAFEQQVLEALKQAVRDGAGCAKRQAVVAGHQMR